MALQRPFYFIMVCWFFLILCNHHLLSQDENPGKASILSVEDEGSVDYGRLKLMEYSSPLPGVSKEEGGASLMPGWPKEIGCDTSYAPMRGMVFADLNGDGTLEILVSSTDKKIYAWDCRGASIPGFPVTTIGMCMYPPSVGDLDGDGDLEIAQFTMDPTEGGRFYLLDHQGNVLPGFPVSINDHNLDGSPTLYDLDNDGEMPSVWFALTSCLLPGRKLL